MSITKSCTIFFTLLSLMAAGVTRADLPPFEGNGTDESPYQIETLDQLQAMQYFLDAHFILMNDIDASETAAETWGDGAGFKPIGVDWDSPFTGVFDGNGKIIKGLTINRPEDSINGLFGYVTTGNIKNVGLVEVDIIGYGLSGALVGWNVNGTIVSCYASGT